MIILDNIIYSLQKAGGVSVVWSELLSGIMTSGIDYLCLDYNSAQNNIFRQNLDIPSSKLIQKEYKFLPIQRYFNPRIDNQSCPFIFHSSYYRFCNNKKAINFTTVHDFTYEYFSRGMKRKIHCMQKYKAILNSQYIICISESTKNDLLKFLPNVDKNKIHVVYNGVSNDYFVLSEKYDNNEYGEYAVFVGARAGYKNFKLAVSSLKHTDLNLVVVGDPLSQKEICFLNKELGNNRYFSLGRISNKELNIIYNQAYCLIYPSLYEGFGIPVLEAQKAGCPVIVVNTPSIVEIIGETDLVADNSIESINEKIVLLEDSSFYNQIVHNGLKNSQKYTWANMCNQIISLYKEALKIN